MACVSLLRGQTARTARNEQRAGLVAPGRHPVAPAGTDTNQRAQFGLLWHHRRAPRARERGSPCISPTLGAMQQCTVYDAEWQHAAVQCVRMHTSKPVQCKCTMGLCPRRWRGRPSQLRYQFSAACVMAAVKCRTRRAPRGRQLQTTGPLGFGYSSSPRAGRPAVAACSPRHAGTRQASDLELPGPPGGQFAISLKTCRFSAWD